ncbi:unnamed protein product [Auanema sp. JU1783]|nr:unnamed protein product [Auanema sp. JU1783]
MSVDFDVLEENMSAYGVNFSSNDNVLTAKISLIAKQFNLYGEELEDEIMAFANNLKKTQVDKALLEAVEMKLQKRLDNDLKTQKIKRPVLAEKLQSSFKAEPPVVETDDFDVEDDKNGVMSDIYAQFAPVKSVPNTKYLSRLNKGTVASQLKGSQFETKKNPSPTHSQVTVLSNAVSENYAGEKTANVIDEICERMKQFADLFRSNNPEIGNWSYTPVSDSEVYIYGVIVNDGDDTDSLHVNNAKIMLDDENGSSYTLDFQHLPSVTIFPGQIVAYQGCFDDDKHTFLVKKDFPLPKLTTPDITKTEADYLTIWSACGPYTSPDTCGYEPLYDLLEAVRKNPPNVLVLMGPFVDRKSKYFTSPTAQASYSSVQEILMIRIAQLLDRIPTQIIIQPSPMREGAHINGFPSSPLTVPHEMVRILGKKLHLVSDPAVVEVDGIKIAITGSEIIAHLSKLETHRSADQENIDRIARLSNHILGQRSLYPLSPPTLATSIEDVLTVCKLTYAPHMIIAPSVLPSLFKNIDGVLVNNPGTYLRGSTGTFSKVDINLAAAKGCNSIVDHSHGRIERV